MLLLEINRSYLFVMFSIILENLFIFMFLIIILTSEKLFHLFVMSSLILDNLFICPILVIFPDASLTKIYTIFEIL